MKLLTDSVRSKILYLSIQVLMLCNTVKKLEDTFLYFTAFRLTASQCNSGFVVVATFSKTDSSVV